MKLHKAAQSLTLSTREKKQSTYKEETIKISDWTSGQDGGIGRHTVPPRTKKRTITNLKTKNNQNWQKIKLYLSPTTKELKEETFIQTARRGRDQQPGGEDSQQGGVWRTGLSYIHVQTNQEEQLGSGDRPHNPGFQHGEIKPQSLWLKTPVGVEAAAAGETPSLPGEFVRETHRVLEHTQARPPWNQHQKGPICLW